MSNRIQTQGYPLPELPCIPERTFNITHYGATGDGLTSCTAAIQAALDECAATGGGKVIIPPGIWRTGPLTLHSRLNLCVEQGALVRFDSDFNQYPLVQSHYEGNSGWRCQAPLDGVGLSDVAITGQGIIDGGGEGWRPVKRFKMTQLQWEQLVASGGALDPQGEIWWPSLAAMEGEDLFRRLQEEGEESREAYMAARAYLRPVLLSLRGCQRVLLEGPTFQNSPAWCLHPQGCEQITIRHVRVRNPWYSQNGDGLDLESCTHALVEHCSFDVGDDAICLKSGKDEEGRRVGLPSQYITIQHCTVYHGHGGVVIGSEMSGGVRAVRVNNCTFIGTDIGLRFKSVRGRGGVVEDIVMENILMSGICYEAISFHLFYEGVEGSEGYLGESIPVTEETPIFRDISLHNLICRGADKALLVNGLPEMPLSDLSITSFRAMSRQGIVLRNADRLLLDEIVLHTQEEDQPKITAHRCKDIRLIRSGELVVTEI